MAKVKAKAAKRLQKKRLLKLADMLIADAKKKNGIKFDITTVAKKSEPGNDDWSDWTASFEKGFQPKLDCSTTACAMGLAALSGDFKKAGLGARIPSHDTMICTTFNGRTLNYDAAAEKVFGLSNFAAQYLFSPCYYNDHDKRKGAAGEREVARRIRAVVKSNGKPPKRVKNQNTW